MRLNVCEHIPDGAHIVTYHPLPPATTTYHPPPPSTAYHPPLPGVYGDCDVCGYIETVAKNSLFYVKINKFCFGHPHNVIKMKRDTEEEC